jgi:hypothetical protein
MEKYDGYNMFWLPKTLNDETTIEGFLVQIWVQLCLE